MRELGECGLIQSSLRGIKECCQESKLVCALQRFRGLHESGQLARQHGNKAFAPLLIFGIQSMSAYHKLKKLMIFLSRLTSTTSEKPPRKSRELIAWSLGWIEFPPIAK